MSAPEPQPLTPDEARSLNEAAAVGLLEPEEAARIAQHREACAPCAAEADALGAALDDVRAKAAPAAPLSPALRAKLLAAAPAALAEGPQAASDAKKPKPIAAADVPEAAALGIKVRLSCSYCHGSMTRDETAFCAACLAPHHAECFRAHGRCSVLGCEETSTVRPASFAAAPAGAPAERDRRRRRGRRIVFPLISAGLVLAGAAAFVEERRRDQVDETRRNERALLEAMAERDRAKAEARAHALEAARLDDLASQRRAELEQAARLDLACEDEPLQSVVDRIARVAQRPILVAPVAQDQRITLDVGEVAWPDALRLVAEAARCEIEARSDDVLLLTMPPRVTIQFTDASVRTVLQLLAAYSGKNVVIASTVQGTLTLDIKEVHWVSALLSCADTLGLDVWLLDEVCLIKPRGEDPPRNAVRLLPPGRWIAAAARVSSDEPRVTLDRSGTGAELADEITRQSGLAARFAEPPGPAQHALSLHDVPGREALAQLGRVLGLDVAQLPEGALLRPRERNRLHAVGAPVRAWCKLLGSLAEQHVFLAPGVQGEVTVDLKDVAYGAALRSTMAALGHGVDDAQGVLRVSTQGRAAPRVGDGTPEFVRVTLADGGALEVPAFQAAALTPQRRLAILGGRTYVAGDELLDREAVGYADRRVLGVLERSVIVDVQGALFELSASSSPEGRPSPEATSVTPQGLLERAGALLRHGIDDDPTLELVAALCERARADAQDGPKLQAAADGLHAHAILRRCGASAALKGGDGARAAELAAAARAAEGTPAGVRELLERFERRAEAIAGAVGAVRERRAQGDVDGARAGYAELLEQKDLQGAYRDEAERALEELTPAEPQ